MLDSLVGFLIKQDINMRNENNNFFEFKHPTLILRELSGGGGGGGGGGGWGWG